MISLFKKEKRFSRFDGIVECLLLEGLTTSYDILKLQQHLRKKFNNQIEIINPDKGNFEDNNFVYNAYSFLLKSKNKHIESELNKILSLFGYFIGHKKEYDIGNSYNIEPKYPIKINNILNARHIKEFYHITSKSNLKKIMKIGLAPRGSETVFYHPDDRIYLINSNNLGIKQLTKMLANDKHLKEEDMIVIKTPYNDKYNYYLDDLTTFKKHHMIACFVLKNIPPEELQIINIK